jgi:hypothetical protein
MRGISLCSEFNSWSGSPSPDMLRMSTSPRKRGEVKGTLPRLHLSPLAGRGRIALAIRVRGGLNKRGSYRFKNAFHITQHVVVPKSQNTIVMVNEPFVANSIACVVGVLPAVYLDDQTMFAANKINRVRTDRLLPNEFVAVERARPEPVPQSGLRFCGRLPQTSSALGFMLFGSAHAATPPHPAGFARRPLPASGERLAPRILA